MGWARFGLDVLETLIWPAVVVLALILFRKRLGALIDSIEEWTGFGHRVKLGKRAKELKAELADRVRKAPVESPPSTPAPQTVRPSGIPSAERVGVPTLKMDGPELEGVIMNALQIGSTSAQLGHPPPSVRVDVASGYATVTFDETNPMDTLGGAMPSGHA